MDNNMNRENSRAPIGGISGLRRLSVVVAGMGISALVAYLVSKALGGRK